MHVLYVDDDSFLTRTVELILQKSGHSCDTAGLGETAVKLAAGGTKYDAIILDIMLPDIDGYEVIERLRAAQVDTPLLIQSGLVDRGRPGDAEAFGADDILVKPYDKDELLVRLRGAIARAEKARAAPAEPAEEKAAAEESNHRHHDRVKAIKACEITFDGETTRCMVLNLSGGGAAIRLPRHMTNCPKHFSLKFPAGRSYDCRVCWRVQDKVGVAFV